MKLYKVEIYYDDNFELHIKKYETNPYYKESQTTYLNQRGFVELIEELFLINMDVEISDNGGKKSMAFTEAMQIQQLLKIKLRENKLERILNE